MNPLAQPLRRKLERAIVGARRTAEAAARAGLERLAADRVEPFGHMSVEARKLRVRLRARARQLGDAMLPRTDEKGRNHDIEHLTQEVAYEAWHRMLFARFLAESHLLMHPSGVPVSLEECKELAPDEGAADGWELAARYAERMLPAIFRSDDPVLQVTLAPEDALALERLLESLPGEVFTADDALGWVYQFWQAEAKDRVNKSGKKIGADELPAVTQLFTEHYMVEFLLHNTLGAWWAGKRLGSGVRGQGPEEELRHAVALPGVTWDYLRFVQDEPVEQAPPPAGLVGQAPPPAPDPPPAGQAPPPHQPVGRAPLPEEPVGRAPSPAQWRLAAGTFDGWPSAAKDLKLLDPCGGSGHFLVAELELLVPIRMAEEGLSAREAVDAVLRDNLHALEIDPRCTQIMAFNLALAAWRYPGAGGYRELPPLNIACCGLAPRAKKEDWLALAGKDERLKDGMAVLHDLFQDAPELGSLIDPTRVGDMHLPSFAEIEPLLDLALAAEPGGDADREARGVAARGIAHAAMLLAGRYHLVATNVPYLTRGKQSEALRSFCEGRYPDAKNEVANVFLDRCLELSLASGAGVVQLVMPQNWLFLTSYAKQRQRLLNAVTWSLLARLGEGAFDSPQAAGAFIILLTLARVPAPKPFLLRGLDASAPRTAEEKASLLRVGELVTVSQADQLQNPDARIVLGEIGAVGTRLAGVSHAFHGQGTFDGPRFVPVFFELTMRSVGWEFLQSTGELNAPFSGCHGLLRWEDGSGSLARLMEAKRREGYSSGKWQAGVAAWGRVGVVITQMRGLLATLYFGHAFDDSVSAIVPHDASLLPSIWCFCSSPEYAIEVRTVDQKLNVTNATLAKVPFDLAHWQAVAAERYPNGLPRPYSDDPTQWLFHGHPCGSVVWDERAKWTARGPLRTDATVLQVAVARLLGYRWPAELEAMELADETRAWLAESAKLAPLGDDDGVVCLPAVGGERPAADRLREVLAAAYGAEWSPAREQELLAAVGYGGRSLDEWLREAFFEQHCKLFHQRPFVWHIWDGRRDGFAALVHYHRLDRKLLERLAYTYLGDWIARQQAELASGIGPAEARLLAARDLQKRLELILTGESPYDIFVRWKPLAEQPAGWEPDLDDGVRLSIRPFVTANVLRKRPGIKWDKDRGKDPASAPWFPVFHGDRINDHHLTLAEKLAARARAAGARP